MMGPTLWPLRHYMPQAGGIPVSYTHLVIPIHTHHFQFASLVGDIPEDDTAVVVVRFYFAHLLTVKQQLGLGRVGVTDHPDGLPFLVVPDGPRIHRGYPLHVVARAPRFGLRQHVPRLAPGTPPGRGVGTRCV